MMKEIISKEITILTSEIYNNYNDINLELLHE